MPELSIKLEGYPEKVQRVADAIDAAFPDLMAWISCPEDTDGITIKIQGYELPVMPMQAPRLLAAEADGPKYHWFAATIGINASPQPEPFLVRGYGIAKPEE